MYNILIREKRLKIKQYLNGKRIILYLMRMIGTCIKYLNFLLRQLKNLISIGYNSKLYTGYYQQIIFSIGNNYLHRLKLIDSP